jgi:hypothetical protein
VSKEHSSLTRPKSQKAYLQDPTICPYCSSTNVHSKGDFYALTTTEISKVIGCADCKAEWDDVYQLKKFVPILRPMRTAQ